MDHNTTFFVERKIKNVIYFVYPLTTGDRSAYMTDPEKAIRMPEGTSPPVGGRHFKDYSALAKGTLIRVLCDC